MDYNYDKDFLQRYLNDDCSEEEKLNFYKWLGNSEKIEKSSWVIKIWEESGKSEEIVLGAEERILQKVLGGITNNSKLAIEKTNFKQVIYYPKSNFWQLNPLLRYASIILAILIPIVVYNFIISENLPQEPVQFTEKVTHNGQHLTFRLDDGTQVTLNANSQLRYPLEFSDSSRVVSMKGEAFFDVAKDSKRPFTVVTGAVSTTALGTSFNVHFHKEESLSEISLITGSVRVEMKDNFGKISDIQLVPGEQLVYQIDNGSYTTKFFDYLYIAGWKDGTIYFKESGINEIIEKLEVWYDVEIEMTGNLNRIKKDNWTYTGKFDNQTLENVLRGISYVKYFSFEINDKNVELMFN